MKTPPTWASWLGLLNAKKRNKRTCDNRCFLRAVLSCCYVNEVGADNNNCGRQYKSCKDDLDTDRLLYHVEVKKVQCFADKNKLIINVFEWDEKKDKVSFDVLITDNLVLYKEH